jgi:hypothetical protein
MLPAPQRQGGIGKKNTAEPAPPNTVVFCNTFGAQPENICSQ